MREFIRTLKKNNFYISHTVRMTKRRKKEEKYLGMIMCDDVMILIK